MPRGEWIPWKSSRPADSRHTKDKCVTVPSFTNAMVNSVMFSMVTSLPAREMLRMVGCRHFSWEMYPSVAPLRVVGGDIGIDNILWVRSCFISRQSIQNRYSTLESGRPSYFERQRSRGQVDASYRNCDTNIPTGPRRCRSMMSPSLHNFSRAFSQPACEPFLECQTRCLQADK